MTKTETIALLAKQVATFKFYGLTALARQTETILARTKRKMAKAEKKTEKVEKVEK